MKEKAIVQQVVSELNTALPATVTVRTGGGDSDSSPPLCVLNWDSTRLNENGHNPLGKVVRDSNGDATALEFHRYHRMELDVLVRAYDESDRDTWLSDVADHFLPYEYDASTFHEDTTEWEIGDAEPRSNPVVEPDWYESGLVVQFKYVSRVTETIDTLETVQEGVYVDESL